MILKNHIATRFLTDDNLALEMLEYTNPNEWKITPAEWDKTQSDKMSSFYELVNNKRQSAYYVTNTVIDKLTLLKVQKNEIFQYDWAVFKNIKPGKRTFIFDKNKVLRIWMDETGRLSMIMIYFEERDKGAIEGTLKWDMFWVDINNNAHSPNFLDERIQNIETFVYKLLCFMFLTDNDELVIRPGQKAGTKKSGKIINTLNVPITIVNSRWNTTVIRNEGFEVSGHFRLQPRGKGRQNTEMIFIQPFQKNGYIRRAKSSGPITNNY